jgi:hypothetical protein
LIFEVNCGEGRRSHRYVAELRRKCRAYDDTYSDALDGSERQTLRKISSLHCHDILDAKLARTPLDTLAPYLGVIKGADPQIAKLVAVWTLYDAYEYGIEQAKKPADKRP